MTEFEINGDLSQAELWKLGILAPWYLKPFQLDMYSLLCRERFPFGEQSRRTGKTTSVLTYAIEEGNRTEGFVTRWCEPLKDQCRKIVMPEIDKIQRTIPKEFRYRYYTTDSFYENWMGSRIYLVGVNDDKGESARGPFAHLIVGDEFGSWREAEYVRKEALMPQLLSTNGKFPIIGTPPRDPGHSYWDLRETAIRKKRFLQKIIWDAVPELYTPEQIHEMAEEYGGEQAIAWQREYLCRKVTDPRLVVVPEFTDSNIVEDDYPRPAFFDVYMAGDSGFDDNTAVLFGWYDFRKNEIVIEEEFVDQGLTTRQVVLESKRIERELWADPRTDQQKKPHRRTYDADKQLVYDILIDHDYAIMPAQKDQRVAALHELRTEVGALRFKVKRRCKNLIRQMKEGVWKDERHTDFMRTDGLGHLDAIAASIYFNRHVDRDRNPMPANHGLHRETHFIPAISASRDKQAAQIARLLKPKARFR